MECVICSRPRAVQIRSSSCALRHVPKPCRLNSQRTFPWEGGTSLRTVDLKGTHRGRGRQAELSYLLVHSCVPAAAGAGSQILIWVSHVSGCDPGLSGHCLPQASLREASQGVYQQEATVRSAPRHATVGCKCPRWHLSCCAKCPPTLAHAWCWGAGACDGSLCVSSSAPGCMSLRALEASASAFLRSWGRETCFLELLPPWT